jgi:hypothetical protein
MLPKPLLGERSESLSGEARRALPGEGVLNRGKTERSEG